MIYFITMAVSWAHSPMELSIQMLGPRIGNADSLLPGEYSVPGLYECMSLCMLVCVPHTPICVSVSMESDTSHSKVDPWITLLQHIKFPLEIPCLGPATWRRVRLFLPRLMTWVPSVKPTWCKEWNDFSELHSYLHKYTTATAFQHTCTHGHLTQK